jgi:hypothetical protein
MRATAWSASLGCHRSREHPTDRSFAVDLEAVFVLVAFRRFAQFSENQRQGADSDDEKACGEHDVSSSKICAMISRCDSFVPTSDSALFNPGIGTSGGCPAETNARYRGISFRNLRLAEFLSAQSVRFFDSFVRS